MATNLISTNFAGGVFEKAGTSTVVETVTTTPQIGPDSLDNPVVNTVGIGEYSTTGNAANIIASTYTTAGKHVIVWQEGSASYPPPKAAVATVTGDAIMYGTGVATSGSYDCEDGLSIAYDQANDKVLVVHSTNNNHGNYMVVGTITGDAIAFGSVTGIDTGSTPNDNSSRPQGMVWVGGIGGDTTNRLVLATKHNSNNDGEARVITISGTTPTPNAVADWHTANEPKDFCMAYVGNSQVVIAYADSGGGILTRVGTVAGGGTNTITWGTALSLSSTNANFGQLAIAYDEQNSKVMIVFVDTATNTRGRYIAAAVTGTGASGTIVYGGGGSTEFETDGSITALTAAYHAGAQKILISFYGTKPDATHIETISATHTSSTYPYYTFGPEVMMMSSKSGQAFLTSSYDAFNKKVLVFRDGGNGYKHGLAVDLFTSAMTLDLTTGNFFEVDMQNGTSYIETITATPGAVVPKTFTFNLKVTQGSFPRQFKWSGSALTKFKWQRYWLPGTGWIHRPTTSTANDAVDVYSFTTYDNGGTWYSSIVGQNIS